MFNGKLRIFDDSRLLLERKIEFLAKCNLLSNKVAQHVYSIEFNPNDGYGHNWGSLLISNQTYVVELEGNVEFIDATLYYTYIYFDYVEGNRSADSDPP